MEIVFLFIYRYTKYNFKQIVIIIEEMRMIKIIIFLLKLENVHILDLWSTLSSFTHIKYFKEINNADLLRNLAISFEFLSLLYWQIVLHILQLDMPTQHPVTKTHN